MKHKLRPLTSTALAFAGLSLIATTFVPAAKADSWDKMTYVTVHERIIAGNKVLEPGTYVWKLLDSQSDRHIVQIFDKDQRHLEETILAIPNYRLEPTGDSRFAFWETPAGVPKAVRAWFFPGDNFGQEFPYPKKLVAQLASAVPTPVPVAYKEPATEPAPKPAPQPVASPEPVVATPTPTPEPAPQPTQEANNSQPPQQEPTLPHTASNIPLIGLTGLTLVCLAAFLMFDRKRRETDLR
jgi:LPXTG-motif cell wall-anchored protein